MPNIVVLPREVQYIVLGFVGWHHADQRELIEAVRALADGWPQRRTRLRMRG